MITSLYHKTLGSGGEEWGSFYYTNRERSPRFKKKARCRMVCKICYLCKQMKINKNLYLLLLVYDWRNYGNLQNKSRTVVTKQKGLGENWLDGGQEIF